MKYTKTDGIHVVEVPVSDFKIVMCDKAKKSAAAKNYCNAGFFAGYSEGGVNFTLPVAHLVCDYAADKAVTKKYCAERGRFNGDKFKFDSYSWGYQNPFYRKAVSSLIVSGGAARIEEIRQLPAACDYAISGVPIMRDGKDVAYSPFVINQGWDSGPLYATYHIFAGLKTSGSDTVYVMGMKTQTYNMVKTAEAYKKFKAMGFRDVIKLDGGGSYHMDVNGKAVSGTSENRIVNSIIMFGEADTSKTSKPEGETNPYKAPVITLRRGSGGEGVRWLQWQLNCLGYDCGAVDGVFGANTYAQVVAFQTKNNLAVDGLVGAKTRAALLK